MGKIMKLRNITCSVLGAGIGIQMLMAADGVGGWWADGIDSGIYSRYLCKSISQYYNDGYWSCPDNDKSRFLKELLAVANRKNPHKGSSTAVMVHLVQAGDQTKIRTLNLGDSGYAIFRKEDDKVEMA